MKYIHNFGQNKSSSCENSIVFSFDYNKCWAACWPILFHSSIKFLHKRLVLIFKSSNWSFSFAYFLRKNKLPYIVYDFFFFLVYLKFKKYSKHICTFNCNRDTICFAKKVSFFVCHCICPKLRALFQNISQKGNKAGITIGVKITLFKIWSLFL